MLSTEEINKKIISAQNGDMQAKTELVIDNTPLIKSIVRRYKNKLIEYDDLIELGTLGLVKAINNFDTAFGVRFSTYAVPMIAGEIKRFIRDDGAIKVSRSVKAKALEINKYIDEYRNVYGDSPKTEDIADKFGLDTAELVFILDSTRYPVSIYAETEDEGLTLVDKIADNTDIDDALDSRLIKDLISKLPEREKKIIMLRYFRDKTQSEVAEELGVSQVQVSRIEAKILAKLKESLT